MTPYKNLRTASNIADAAIDGSMRASDLDMKIGYLRRRNEARVVTFATATPIANSVTEAYVMQRYLRPDLLEAAVIEVFDTWAATFGQIISQVELAPEGGSSFRLKSRFVGFRNVPEMLRMLHVAADVKTSDDLNLPVAALTRRQDGQRATETVTVEPSDELLAYVAELGDRAEKVRSRAVTPEEDNMLKISGDGRRAALDLRLAGLPQDTLGKIETAAARIAGIWETHHNHEYTAPDGSPYPAGGALHERKARFIGQVMRGKLDAREIGDTALSFSEVKALATGNPLLMDKAEADVALARLQRAERAHHRNQDAPHHAVARC